MIKFLKATYYINSTHNFFLISNREYYMHHICHKPEIMWPIIYYSFNKVSINLTESICNGMLDAEQDVIPLTEYSIKLQLYLRIYSKRMWVITFGVLCISHDEMASSHCLLLPRQTVDRPSSGCTLGTGKARVSFPAGGTAGPFKVKQSVMGVWSED